MKETVLLRAEFNPKVKTYWILSSCLIMTVIIVTIPLLVIWIPVSLLVAGRYLRSLECVLTTKAIHVKKGVLVRVEKTIPLDKITDVGMSQGPIQRALGLETMTFETAGSSSPGALVGLVGVVGAREFRDAVLEQKNELAEQRRAGDKVEGAAILPAAPAEAGSTELLREISDTLKRIEARLPQKGAIPES